MFIKYPLPCKAQMETSVVFSNAECHIALDCLVLRIVVLKSLHTLKVQSGHKYPELRRLGGSSAIDIKYDVQLEKTC